MPATDRMKVLAVAGILLVSAGAGIATLNDDAPADETKTLDRSSTEAPPSSSGEASGSSGPAVTQTQVSGPSQYEGKVLKEWTKSFDGAPSTGNLDLRIDHGPVKVVGWDKPKYHIMVLQGKDKGQKAHDYETKVSFSDQGGSDAINVKLTVDRDGTYGVGVESAAGSTEDPHRKRAIVAFVPAETSYEEVNACSGQEHQFENAWEDTWGSAPWPWAQNEVKVDVACMKSDSSPDAAVHADLRMENNESEEEEDHPFGIEASGASNIDASTLTLASSYGDLKLQNVGASDMLVLAEHGSIGARGLSADNASLVTGYGDVAVRDAHGADLFAASSSGDVAVDFTPTGDGTLALLSDYGEVLTRVTPPGQVGYDIRTGTDYGDLTIAVSNTSVEKQSRQDNESWQDPSHWTGIFQENGYEKTATGTSASWDGAAVQTEIRAFTESGDVAVTDGSQGPIDWDGDDDEDDEDDGER